MPKKIDLHQTTDARVWTKEWLKTIKKNPSIPMDEGTMIGWFANAIMAGYDNAKKKCKCDPMVKECCDVCSGYTDSEVHGKLKDNAYAVCEKLTARLMKVDSPIKEGERIYPKNVVESAIENVKDAIRARRFFVSLQKPEATAGFRLTDIMGIVTNLYIGEDDYVYADIDFIDTPAYKTFQLILKAMPWLETSKLFTMVLLGSVHESSRVQDDYELLGVSTVFLNTEI